MLFPAHLLPTPHWFPPRLFPPCTFSPCMFLPSPFVSCTPCPFDCSTLLHYCLFLTLFISVHVFSLHVCSLLISSSHVFPRIVAIFCLLLTGFLAQTVLCTFCPVNVSCNLKYPAYWLSFPAAHTLHYPCYPCFCFRLLFCQNTISLRAILQLILEYLFLTLLLKRTPITLN